MGKNYFKRNWSKQISELLFLFCFLFACKSPEDRKIEKLQSIIEKAQAETRRLPPIEELETTAQAGGVQAQNDLAMRHRYGRKAPKDFKLAYEWFIKAAKQGHANAQREIASYYYFLGSNPSFDIPQRIKDLSPKEKYEFALFWFTESAKGCEGEAEYNLSSIAQGYGLASSKYPIPPDPAATRKWMLLAAEHKYNRAIYDLTDWYLKGKIVPLNYSEGIAWNLVAKALDIEVIDEDIDSLIESRPETEKEKAKIRADELLKQLEKSCTSRVKYQAGDVLPHFPE